MVGILEGMKAGESTENNTRAFSALIAFSGAVWCKWSSFFFSIPGPNTTICILVTCALPWFILEKRHPGLSLPSGSSLLTIGFRQTYVAIQECMQLKQTFLYLIFYFLMYAFCFLLWCVVIHQLIYIYFYRGDVLNTTVYVSNAYKSICYWLTFSSTVIGTLQNKYVSINFSIHHLWKQIVLLHIPPFNWHCYWSLALSPKHLESSESYHIAKDSILEINSSSGFWLVQKKYKISTKQVS